ncbi:peptidylprolyl isomerase [Synechococcus sp. Lug-A]|uniref:peptidylprolyl isomerase n=1 Tax=Synechococcus sp. Lug-A TaxID=2823740 RepID=UPI0020CE0082|nr:peptidylprolyl isomerase [Synechococcus sp. Lug-A]MCP9847832.1 peptidylprolyl isomerase [Synechococcus sp. Lug-A]
MRDEILAELSRHGLLLSLLQRRVVAEAVADQPLDPEALRQAQEQFFRQNNLDGEAAVQAFLSANGLGPDDLAWQIALPLRIRAHCREHFRHKAEAHFLSRKNQLDRVVYSLLRVKDRFLARELYLRLEAEEASFATLAKEFAEGPEKQTNGIVGPVPLTQAHPVLSERLRTTSPGVLMQPFQLTDWWLVVRLESYTPATFDEAMADMMAAELFDHWIGEETTRRIKSYSVSGVMTAPA